MTKAFYAALITFDLVTYSAPFFYPTYFYYTPVMWTVGILWPSLFVAAIYERLTKKARVNKQKT